MCVYIFFFMSSTLTIRVFVNCVVMVSCSTQNWAVRSYTSVCACCKLQEHKRVIGMVASPWFPIITVMNPRLLSIHRCSSNCSAVKWLSPKIGVGCFSTLSLWQQGIFFFKVIPPHDGRMSKCFQCDICWVCVRVCKTDTYQRVGWSYLWRRQKLEENQMNVGSRKETKSWKSQCCPLVAKSKKKSC